MSHNPSDQRQWNEIFASVPPEWKEAPPSEAMKACKKFFIDGHVMNVLDLGCGVGCWAVYLANNGMRVKASDFSSNAIDFARAWAAEAQLDIVFAAKL